MTVFSASPALLALNVADPQERVARINALAGLVEHFQIELAFDEDRFVGLRDRLPPPLVGAAVG